LNGRHEKTKFSKWVYNERKNINYDINLMILKLDDGNSINIIEMVNIKRSLIIVYTIYPA
jgi:hypothetical protein